jgi:hypothetical protein
MPVRSRFASATIAFCAIVGGCTSYPPPATIDGYKPPAIFAGFASPLVSRNSCVDSVAREYKVPKENVKPISDMTTMTDGFYVVTLSIGAGQPAINCTVNENGVVSDVIRAR